MDLNTILAIAGLGSSVAGGVLGSRAQGQANQMSQESANRLYGLAEEEQRRRLALTNGILPSLNRNLRLPAGTGVQSLGAPPPPQGSTGNMPQQSYAPPNGSGGPGLGGALKKGIGGAGAGALLGSQIGAIGGPIGMGIGAGVGAAASQIGKIGANEANTWTNQKSGPQAQLLQRAQGIIDPYNAAKASGSLTPEQQAQAQKSLEELISWYSQVASQYGAQGSKQKNVIGQSYNTLNPIFAKWRQTVGGA